MAFNIYSKVTALTGSIGSGKTTAALILQNLGAHVVSADRITHSILENDSKVLEEITDVFGSCVVQENGQLSRSALAAEIFANPAKRKKLEEILHPKIREIAKEELSKAVSIGCQPVVYDVPLYFEAGLNELGFKTCVLIAAADETCIKRVSERDKVSPESVRLRLAAQMPLSEKRKLANIVIENNGSFAELEDKIKQLFPRLISA